MAERILNISVTCAKCGEELDTNELSKEDIDSAGCLNLDDVWLVVPVTHECLELDTEDHDPEDEASDVALEGIGGE